MAGVPFPLTKQERRALSVLAFLLALGLLCLIFT